MTRGISWIVRIGSYVGEEWESEVCETAWMAREDDGE